MPVVLVPDVGASNANTYADLPFYKSYIESRIPAVEWKLAAINGTMDDELASDLVSSCRLLSYSFIWTGAVVSPAQALPWPMTGMSYQNGGVIPDNVIPISLKYAQCELGVLLREGTVSLSTPDYIREGIKSVDGGDAKVEFQSFNPTSRDTTNNQLVMANRENSHLGLIPASVLIYLDRSWYIQPEYKPNTNKPKFFFEVI